MSRMESAPYFFRSFDSLLRMRLHSTPGHYPSTSGQAERVNRTLVQHLGMYCNYEQDNWSTLYCIYYYSQLSLTSGYRELRLISHSSSMHSTRACCAIPSASTFTFPWILCRALRNSCFRTLTLRCIECSCGPNGRKPSIIGNRPRPFTTEDQPRTSNLIQWDSFSYLWLHSVHVTTKRNQVCVKTCYLFIYLFIYFCGGKKGNASCTVTLVCRVWDSSTARRLEQPPVGQSAA